jgi:hypothetical protein
MKKLGFLFGASLSLGWLFGLAVIGTWYWDNTILSSVSFFFATWFALMAALGFFRFGQENPT